MSAKKYTGGRIRLLTAAASLLLLLSGGNGWTAPDPTAWRPAPAYVALFTPAVPRGAYSTYVSPQPLDTLLDALRTDPSTLHPPGAWSPQPTIALDAFGRTGTYNPWTVARLYGARRARVARGPRHLPDGTSESWTLISPYPNAAFDRLESGTLLIVVRIP